MKALRWHGRRDIRLEEIPRPALPGPGQVQLRTLWCGICGTDIEEWLRGPIFIPDASPNPLTGGQAPLVLGHEVTGEIVAIGAGVHGLTLGDVVAVDGLMSCGTCHWCVRSRPVLCPSLSAIGLMCDGGLAEYCNVPARGCVRLPDGLASDDAALAETLAVGVRALRRGRFADEESLAIYGAGAVGLLAAQAAAAWGARSVTVVDPISERRDLVASIDAAGVIRAISPEEADRLTDIDLALECSGSPHAFGSALNGLRAGGRLVLVGLASQPVSLPSTDVVVREKEIIGSLSHVYDQDFSEAVRLLGSGAVVAGPLVSARRSLDEVIDAFHEHVDQPGRHVKILISPNEVSR